MHKSPNRQNGRKPEPDLSQIAWMLQRKNVGKQSPVSDYGDLSQLNKEGLILTMLGREQLQEIVSDYLDLLETSAAVYERNGDYAFGMFTSGWCRLMDSSSRKLCNTSDNLEALQSGKWLCHESCWQDASLACIQQGKPVDVACAGGLRLYAMPVKAGGKVVGTINFGYGDPPSDEAVLAKLSAKYVIPLDELRKQAKAYRSRPVFIIELAKRHLHRSAKYIGNIIERKLAEEALRESKATIKNKLKVILEPEGDIETLNLGDIIDAEELQTMMEDFHKTSQIGGAILDVSGNVLVGVAWSDICAKFHRAHPKAAKNCLESDLVLTSGVPAGTFKAYRCKNNMWDMVSPIEIGGKHLGNIFIGQFFYEDEHVDYELFKKQARQHGFDEKEYMAALDRVPRLKRETVASAMAFYTKLAKMISSLSYSKIKLSRDIAQRKRAALRLKESEERFQRMLALIPDMISIHDKDFNIVYSNWKGFAAVDEAKRKLYTKCYKTYRDMEEVCPDCRAKEVLKTKKAFQTEAELPDGTWIDLRVIPVLDKNGELELFVEWVRDITEQKKTLKRQQILYQVANEMVINFELHELIKAVEQKLSQLIDTSNFYVALYDAETGMLSAPFEKDEMDEIDTWPAERSATGLVIKKKQSVLLKKPDVLNLIESGEIDQTGSLCEAWLGVPVFSGDDVTGVIVVQSYKDADAFDNNSMEILEYVSNQVSIALDRAQTFEDLVQAKLKAEESDRLKSAFLANVSHEIRTPMNSILGFLELMKEPRLEEERRYSFIDIVNKSAQRLLVTINDIVELSKIEAGQVDVNVEAVDLKEFMKEQYAFFNPRANEKNLLIKLSVQLDGKDAKVLTDKHKLEGIMINLVNNAIKFTKKGSIELGCYLQDDQTVFFVKDTGMGIPEDKQQAIFDRFTQADSKLTRKHEGSGLGLSIVKAYSEMLNGKISLQSEMGKGSTFYLSIPYEPADSNDVAVENEEASTKKVQGEHTLLIAEDDDDSYNYLETILKREGFTLIRTFSGAETVKQVRQNPGIAVVLMDLRMSGMDGLEATGEIRKFNKDVPIIAQTAHALEGDKNICLEAGCTDYISKPIKRQELLNLIRTYTDRRSS